MSRTDTDFEKKFSRTTMDTRSVSPRGRTARAASVDDATNALGNGNLTTPLENGSEKEKPAGRRSFFQDGMNED